MKKLSHEEYINLLEKFDSETEWEFPKNFDWESAEKKYQDFVDELKKILSSVEITTDNQIQDASYHLSIQLKPNKNSKDYCEVRLSNFGQLITILNIDLLNREMVDLIENLMSKYEFHYVPIEILTKPYNGRLKGFSGEWFTRFFDYM